MPYVLQNTAIGIAPALIVMFHPNFPRRFSSAVPTPRFEYLRRADDPDNPKRWSYPDPDRRVCERDALSNFYLGEDTASVKHWGRNMLVCEARSWDPSTEQNGKRRSYSGPDSLLKAGYIRCRISVG